MIMGRKLAFAFSAAALAIGGGAYAQDGDTARRGMDMNGDGIVTRAEAEQSAAAMFARMDANGDGKLDQADRAAMRAKMKEKRFAMLDTNGDGSISKEEYTAERERKGRRGDRAGAGAEGDKPGWHKRGADGKRGKWGRRGGGHHAMMKMADTNGDGAVDQSEFVAAAMKRFETMDANGDGQVTAEERKAHHEAMKAKWQAKKAN